MDEEDYIISKEVDEAMSTTDWNIFYTSNEIDNIERKISDYARLITIPEYIKIEFEKLMEQFNNIKSNTQNFSESENNEKFNQFDSTIKEFKNNLEKYCMEQSTNIFLNYVTERQKTDNQLKEDISKHLESSLAEHTKSINSKYDTEMNKLLKWKNEKELEVSFGENIKNLKLNSPKKAVIYLTVFIFVISLIPILFVFQDFLPIYRNSLFNWGNLITKLSLTLPIGFLSKILFSQYKLNTLMSLKYTHLYNFLGGGATHLSQLVGDDNDAQKEINQKITRMFLEIDDMMNVIIKQNHPAEDSLKILTDSVDKISDTVVKVSKSIKN